jgi:DNA-binding Xre family transcriptional regulator
MKTVQSRLKILLAEKEVREGRTITMQDVVRESGVARSTALRLANNTMRRVPLDEAARLCDYFGCDKLDDLLQLRDAPTT